ncbi:MAG TPA: DUF1559 domain-containing protein, partial [Pirellulaceae bacterium]
RRQLAWIVFLLPYLEESALADRLSTQHAYGSERNRAAGGTPLPLFLCPTTARTSRVGRTTGDRNQNGQWDPGEDLAYTDYGGLYGVSFPVPRILPEHEGVLIYERPIRSREVLDGLTHTAMVGECTGRDVPHAAEWINGQNIFDQTHNRPINYSQYDELWSDHPGGAQLGYCDGHAGFVSEDIDQAVLLASLTRRGKEVPSWR